MAYKSNSIRWKKSIQGFSYALGSSAEHFNKWARTWMSEAVQESLAQIDADWEGETHWKRASGKISSFGGDHFHPWYTGQLHDSVAGIVSDQHRVISIGYLPPSATKPQTYRGQTIIGHDWAIRGAQRIARSLRFVPGIKATLIVGVPYAEDVDESRRHAGFIRELSNQFAAEVEDYFMIKAEGFRSRFVAKV